MFGDFWPFGGPPAGPRFGQHLVVKHSLWGTTYHPNRPLGGPIGGQFSSWKSDQQIYMFFCCLSVLFVAKEFVPKGMRQKNTI